MLRTWTAAIVAALAITPVGFAEFHVALKDAAAVATFRSQMLMPGKTRTFGSAGEFRVCNEGSQPVHMMVDNDLTNTPNDSILEPHECTMNIGTMMRFKNDSQEPVMLYAYGGMGGRPGRGPGHV